MDEPEFRRRIEVYCEAGLPSLAEHRQEIAAALSPRLWPLVKGWQGDRDSARSELAWIAKRLREEWPEVLAKLSLESTGSEVGWP